MTRQDINQRCCKPRSSTAPTAPMSRRCRPSTRRIRTRSRPAGASSSTRSATIPPASTRPREGASWRRPNWPATPKGDLINALDGDWPATEKAIADKLRARAAAAPDAAHERRRDPSRHPRLRARADDDPRLSHARPSARQSRSARPRAAEGSRGAASRDLRLPREPTRTARSSSTTCSGSNSRPCARCWRSCAAPIAARSASSSSTSPIPPRRPGSRSASRGRTRRSSSPRKASARSCRSWSRPRASRISSTSNIPAASASASTAPRR